MLVLQEIVSDRLENKQFLKFEDAVTLSRQIEAFFNSPESDSIIIELAEKFNLGVKENFVVNVPTIEKNCKECMGCHAGGCILGCFISGPGEPQKVCFWDEAIEAVIGTKLVVHEYGHVIFEQIFTNNLDEEREFQISESFAQYMEDNFTIDISSCVNCSQEPLSETSLAPGKSQNEVIDVIMEGPSRFLDAIIWGIGFGVGAAALGVIVSQFKKDRDPDDQIGLI